MSSNAEHLVLEALHDQAPDSWQILHSVWIKEHPRKQHAEIDFVVITDRAVLLLEVKGGEVRRDGDGVWYQRDIRGGSERRLAEGPIDQVRSAYYSLRSHIFERAGESLWHDRVWGYGAVFPECIFELSAHDPAIHRPMVIDRTRFPEGLAEFLDELADYWQADNLHMKEKLGIPQDRLRAKIGAKDQDRIKRLIQPLVTPVRGPVLAARDAEAQLIELTNEQSRALDFHDPDQSLIIHGAAGTGKTVLALEQARRRRMLGERVLFVCFNSLLAETVRRQLDSDDHEIDVFSFHQLLSQLGQTAGFSPEPIHDWKQFNLEVEERVLDILDAWDGEFSKYDYLIMDEGQDLMTEPFVNSLELLLDGGWDQGHWTICIDPRQAIFQSQYDGQVFDKLKQLASICPLTLNCRNTVQVAAHAHGLSGIEAVPTRAAEGPAVEIIWYHDEPDRNKRLRTYLNSLINELSDLPVESQRIVILAASRVAIPSDLLEPGFLTRPVVPIDLDAPDAAVQCGTLQSYKGLEAPAVVLLGFEDLAGSLSRQLLYVGGSRARTFLGIVFPDTLATDVRDRMGDVFSLLAGP